MMKSVRLFNANTLFKVSLAMIVMVAAIYVIGFFVGSAAVIAALTVVMAAVTEI